VPRSTKNDHIMDDPADILGRLMLPRSCDMRFRLFGFTEADEALMHRGLLEYVYRRAATSLLDYLQAREKREQLGASILQ